MIIISLQGYRPMSVKFITTSFADYIIGQRKCSVTFLDKLNKFIDLKPKEKTIKHKKTKGADGRYTYPVFPFAPEVV